LSGNGAYHFRHNIQHSEDESKRIKKNILLFCNLSGSQVTYRYEVYYIKFMTHSGKEKFTAIFFLDLIKIIYRISFLTFFFLLFQIFPLYAQNFLQPLYAPHAIAATAMAYSQSGDIYIGSRRGWIFRSTNDGLTWDNIVSSGNNINALAVNSQNELIMASYNGDYGLQKTNDFGKTWNGIGPISNRFENVTAMTYHDSVLYVACSMLNYPLSKSTDNGLTWNRINGIWDSVDMVIRALAVGQSNELFVVTDRKEILSSTDNGANWKSHELNTGVHGIIIDSVGKIFVSTDSGLFISNDNGSHWHNVSSIWLGRITFGKKGTLIAASDKGIVRSTDEGNSWTPCNISNAFIQSLCVDQKGKIFAGSGTYRTIGSPYGDGLYSSIDNGNIWERNNISNNEALDITCLAISPKNEIFAGTAQQGIFRSINEGITWSKIDSGNWYNANSILITQQNTILIALHDGGSNNVIRRLTVNSKNWDTQYVADAVEIRNLFSNKKGTIYANGIYQSYDEGQTWSKHDSGEYWGSYSSAIDSLGNIFVGGTEGHISLSSDDGITWKAVSVDSGKNYPILALAIDKNNNIYAGASYSGIYFSSDHGNTWMKTNTGLGINNVHALAIDNEGYIYAATDGLGVFRSVNSTLTVKQPTFVQNQSNFPNPFSQSTNIAFTIPQQTFASLIIYDVLGKEVATIASRVFEAGKYEIPFDASALPSGMYFYKLDAGTFSTMKAIILSR
jgi:photosystem II stability/assembly factor-like uncharacterized protein